MEMPRKRPETNEWLERLAELSKKHLQAAVSEQWDAWENIVREKTDICRRLECCHAIDEKGARLIDDIRKLESQALSALKEKKKGTLRELVRIGKCKKSVRYAETAGRKTPRRHFGIIC